MYKKLYLLAVVFISIMFMSGSAVFATQENTKTDAIPIYTIEDLYGINNNMSGKYILMNDIDLSETSNPAEWVDGWIPIGMDVEYPDSDWFSGEFDGNGHKIFNMVINQKGRAIGVGLFGKVSKEALIKNLGLENINIVVESADSVGGIAGLCVGKIQDCYVTGSIKAESIDYLGEGIGGISCAGRISNTYADVDISIGGECDRDRATVGGLMGGRIFLRDICNSYFIGEFEFDSQSCEQPGIYAISNKESKNCYYLNNSVGDDYARALSNRQMKMQTIYTGFDFTKTWVMDKYSSYPYPQLRNCMQVRLQDIQLLSEPDKLDYVEGDKLDLAGATVKLVYEDGYSDTVDLPNEMVSYRMEEGEQEVIVSYLGCEAQSFTINVKATPEELKIVSSKKQMKVGQNYTYKVKYVGNGTVSFKSSNEKVLRINKKTGKAIAKKAGKVSITVTAGKCKKTIKVTIKK